MLSVNTNVMSLNSQRALATNQSGLATAMARLSSGLRVNSARDDAAGIAIAATMDTVIRGDTVAIRNANDGISVAQTAEGGLVEVTNMLQRIRELAVQSASGQYSDTPDRANLNAEVTELTNEITRLATATQFDGQALLDGTYGSKTFQVGSTATDTVALDLTTADITGITITGVATAANATTTLGEVDAALATVNTARATLGAIGSRFQSVVSSLQVTVENTAASRGRIMDADFGAETAALTRGQILQQAGIAMLAQANASPQNVLALLK